MVLISEHHQLYPNEEPQNIKISPHQQDTQRCKVEWLSQEHTAPPCSTDASSKTLKENSQSLTPSMDDKLSTPSPVSSDKVNSQNKDKDKGKTDEKVDVKTEEEGEVAISPSKQSKALPSWKCTFKGTAASGGPRGKMGGSAGDVSAAGGSKWLMNGLSSLRAHRRAISSGEKVKDSTLSLKDSAISLKETTLPLKDSHRDSDEESSRTSLSLRVLHQSHRLSAYDNVAPSSLSLPADTSSIWTPFEISLSETEGSDKLEQVTDRTNTFDHSASGNEEDVAGTNEDFTRKLTQLKQELKTQKLNYETCISK